jgi:hypothetical protein
MGQRLTSRYNRLQPLRDIRLSVRRQGKVVRFQKRLPVDNY